MRRICGEVGLSDKYLVSTGGVGSCAVEAWAHGKLCEMHNGQPWSAHTRNPKIVPRDGEEVRVLYIVGNPYNQLLSFHRRGFLSAPYRHCQHVGGNVQALEWRKEWTLEEYLDQGEDLFRLESHFDGWWKYAARRYEVMFVRYETMPTVIEGVAAWLGVEANFAFKPRASDVFKQPPAVREKLVEMYGRFAMRVCDLPPLIIKRPGDA